MKKIFLILFLSKIILAQEYKIMYENIQKELTIIDLDGKVFFQTKGTISSLTPLYKNHLLYVYIDENNIKTLYYMNVATITSKRILIDSSFLGNLFNARIAYNGKKIAIQIFESYCIIYDLYTDEYEIISDYDSKGFIGWNNNMEILFFDYNLGRYCSYDISNNTYQEVYSNCLGKDKYIFDMVFINDTTKLFRYLNGNYEKTLEIISNNCLVTHLTYDDSLTYIFSDTSGIWLSGYLTDENYYVYKRDLNGKDVYKENILKFFDLNPDCNTINFSRNIIDNKIVVCIGTLYTKNEGYKYNFYILDLLESKVKSIGEIKDYRRNYPLYILK